MKKIIPLILIAGLIVGAYYIFFSKDEWSEEGLSTNTHLSEEQKYLESITEEEVKKQVFFTMPETILKPQFGGKVFCASELYGFDIDTEELILNTYLWGYCEEYYIKGEVITLGTGVSQPMRIVYKVDRQKLVFDHADTPEDGSEYTSSIKRIIPKEYIEKAMSGADTENIIPSPKTQADNYYTGKLEVYF